MKKLVIVLWSICLLPLSALSYGQRGHLLVGAIADLRLAKDKKIAAKVRDLLDGITLEAVASFPDAIKGWDDCGRPAGQYSVPASKRINAELRAFVKANPCDSEFDHHQFHYTDVPVAGNEKYRDGTIGRSDRDIVHMIAFCMRVLANKEPQPNPRAITKSVAVILLTHYIGDIHQPLHVGAEFFDENGNAFEPKAANKGFEDQGGNKLNLFLFENEKPVALGRFHGYWDTKAVENIFGETPNSEIAVNLAKTELEGWKLTGTPESLAEQIANDMLPIAREAHSRLEYSKVGIEKGSRDITGGRAAERIAAGQGSYAQWSQATVKNEITKAGWQLAAILVAAVK
ncbi:MAG: S1/P1 nuclease [Pyrinomonadaceae bacterium]